MKTLKIKILSWLLHQANKGSKCENFYKIKNKLLARYGTVVGQDIQFIEGKKCNRCYRGVWYSEYSHHKDICWHCNGSTWFKRPFWVYLDKMQFGKFIFHQPTTRTEARPVVPETITGYIEHRPAKHTELSRAVLYFLFDRPHYWKQVKANWRGLGVGYYYNWWRPKNFVSNVVHLFRKGPDAIPLRNWKVRNERKYTPPAPVVFEENDDLPF